MEEIFKYLIEPGLTSIDMPVGAKILSAAFQFNELFIWAQVDCRVNAQLKPRVFRVYATGHRMADDTDDLIFINTVFMGSLVLHVFEKKQDGSNL